MSSETKEAPGPRDYRWLLLAGVIAVGGLVYWFNWANVPPVQPTVPVPKKASLPLPALSPSPFLNTKLEVKHVGSAACRECHQPHFHSYGRTGMGRSMAAVDVEREPSDAAFDHPKSKARYQVVRKDGQVWHRELLLHGGAEEVVLSEFALKYVVGSGRAARTYLTEADGFLVESPITWYRTKGWGMSPGYDREGHSGFERAVGESCLRCHAGQAEALDGSVHRMQIKEPAIGCERCHGPGALHVERRTMERSKRERDGAAELVDHTIVNPAHLSRELAEAICQQCHLDPIASVPVRGRAFGDFRPGLPLQDFRHDYRLEGGDKAMTVVGHVEQMHLSRCYQKSKTFTCTTCHDPHAEVSPRRQEAHYRAVCLECHQPQHCTVKPAVREEHSPSNNCVRCHMPVAPTEVQHVAFTQHRVGIYDPTRPPAAPTPTGPATFIPLVAFHDLSGASDVDRRRSLGMAHFQVARKSTKPAALDGYVPGALDLMTKAHEDGLRDGDFLISLARLRYDLKLDEYLPLVEEALVKGCKDPENTSIALFLKATEKAKARQPQDAIPLLRELATRRRQSSQMLLLAQCEMEMKAPDYIQWVEAAVRINPRLEAAHRHLADYYRKKKEEKKADFHEKRAGP